MVLLEKIFGSYSMVRPSPQPDATQLLFCADRAQHVHTVIEPALQNGVTVISDRYALSTIIYGAVQGIDPAWLRQINERFIQPDMTFITLPPFEVCAERMGKRDVHDHYEKNGLPRKIYDAYAALSEQHIYAIDTSGRKEDVAEEIWQKVKLLLVA
jgi:dTMP kinase